MNRPTANRVASIALVLAGLPFSCGDSADSGGGSGGSAGAGHAGSGGSSGASGSGGSASGSSGAGGSNAGSGGGGGASGAGNSGSGGASGAGNGGSGGASNGGSGGAAGSDAGPSATGGSSASDGGTSDGAQAGGSGRDASSSPDAASQDAAIREAGRADGDGGTRSLGCGTVATRPNAGNLINISVGGMNRSYQLFVPPNYAADTAYPLVVTFHGGGGSSASSRTEMRLEAAPKGLVVYLNYVNNGWSYADGSVDIAYYQAVRTAVENQFCIDTHRVLITGFSLGAIQSNGIGCIMGGKAVRAIVPIDGSGPYPQPAPPSESVLACPQGTPVGDPAVMIIHGSNDMTALYKYGQWSANYWRKANGCSETPVNLTAPMNNCVGYQGCRAPVNFCTHSGDHMVPTTAGALVWAFLDTLK